MTRRTIFRDLRALQAAGVPVVFDEARRCYQLKGAFMTPPAQLTEAEMLALVCVAGKLAATLQTPLLKEVQRALAKFRGQVAPATLEKLVAMERRLEFHMAGMEDGRAYADVFAQVDLALQQRRVLLCQYEAAGDSAGKKGARQGGEPFELRPYGLFWSKGASYVVGHHGGRQALRTLRLSRFVQVEMTKRSYRIPKGFSLREYLGNAWGIVRGEARHEVELRFTGLAAQIVEEGQWHPTQSTVRLPDGSLQFTCQVDGLAEIAPWVLSMGPHCRIVSPQALRDEVTRQARLLLEQYAEAS